VGDLAARGHEVQRRAVVADLGGHANSSFQLVEALDWIPIFGIQYKLGVDGLSLALIVLTTTLSWISILASFAPSRPGSRNT
jgi:NADH:ubiquinone oxidoreductase subunit 4 (subunit M)